MAPPEGERGRNQDERGPPPWIFTDDDFLPTSVVTTEPSVTSTSGLPMASLSPYFFLSPQASSHPDLSTTQQSNIRPSVPSVWPPQYQPSWPGTSWPKESTLTSTETKTWRTLTSVTASYSEDMAKSPLSETSTTTVIPTDSPSTTDSFHGRPHGFGPQRKHVNSGSMYAAAAIVPVVVLAIIGIVAFFCLRKRRNRKAEAAATQFIAQEMKMQPQPLMQPHMAPPPPAISISRQHTEPPSQLPPTSTSSQFQPVILGPIGSGSNGAYMTGMDTSDMVSVTSNTLRPADPFADNSSMTEPPPPYRPNSVAPPSFASTSRQSSLRASALPASSRTHLMGRSPFDDPDDDDISELSGPTLGKGDDRMSTVSDMSYQHDPVVGDARDRRSG